MRKKTHVSLHRNPLARDSNNSEMFDCQFCNVDFEWRNLLKRVPPPNQHV